MCSVMLTIQKAYETASPDVKLDPERVRSVIAYNEALQEVGVLLALNGLHPPSRARGCRSAIRR